MDNTLKQARKKSIIMTIVYVILYIVGLWIADILGDLGSMTTGPDPNLSTAKVIVGYITSSFLITMLPFAFSLSFAKQAKYNTLFIIHILFAVTHVVLFFSVE